MEELITDEGVLRICDDGVLELFRDLDGRSASRVLVWGCDAMVHDQGEPHLTFTLTRKRLPVISLKVSRSDRRDAEALVAAITARAHLRPRPQDGS